MTTLVLSQIYFTVESSNFSDSKELTGCRAVQL